MIEKEIFVEVMETLQKQMAYDKKTADIMAEAFGIENFTLYDNSLLIKQIISLLGIWFDIAELNHYVFDLNFGKPSSDSECLEIGDFYDNLIKG